MSRKPRGVDDGVAPRSRPRARGLASLGAALALAGAAAIAPSAVAHDGDTGDGSHPYLPPPVVDAGRPTGAFLNTPRSAEHEVWLVDQSNTSGPAAAPTHGGRIYIYDGATLRRDPAAATPEVVELGAATSAMCMGKTGANPVRPHMIYFNAGSTHAILSFVASGHVVIFDASTREPLECFRTEVGAGGARQAHATVPTPDNGYILVANQNGKKFERIATDYATNTFTQEPGATLDLTTGTAPSGSFVETPGAPLIRPDNAPICPFLPASGYPAFVSLRGGGMLAVDPYATPMRIVADYPATDIARDGCGFTEARGWVYGNGGSNPGNNAGWFLYRITADGARYSAENGAGNPAPQLIDRDTHGPRDAHGVVTVRDKYVWMFDRASHVVQVYNATTGATESTVNLRTPASQAPAPDIVGISPDGWAVYAATRGPNPLSGAHAATGDAPGLMVLEVRQDGRGAAVRGHVSVSNVVIDANDVEKELADPHGLAVRPIG